MKLSLLILLTLVLLPSIVSAATFEHEEEEIRWTDPLPPPPPEPVDVGYQYNGTARYDRLADVVEEFMIIMMPIVIISATLILFIRR